MAQENDYVSQCYNLPKGQALKLVFVAPWSAISNAFQHVTPPTHLQCVHGWHHSVWAGLEEISYEERNSISN